MNLFKISIPFLLAMIPLVAPASASEKTEYPNILFIVVDDLRPELGCYGSSEVLSPHIDRLASEGTLFERAICQVPVCGASRASLMTGLYPTADRFLNYHSRADKDAPGIPDIPGWLKRVGYNTLSYGKVYHNRNDNEPSWDKIDRSKNFGVYQKPENQKLPRGESPAYEAADVSDEDYPTGKMTESILKEFKRAKNEGTPFFIAAGFTKPHLPFNAPKKYWDLYDREQINLADNPFVPEGAPRQAIHQWNELRKGYGGIPQRGPLPNELARTLIHGYLACVSYTDAMIGRLLAELDALGMRDDTIVVLWGDHGWQLGEHSLWCKHALFDTSLNAPLIIRAPGQTPGQRVSSLVEFVDIYPTICELAGLELPVHLQGESLVPLVENPEADLSATAFARYHSGEAVLAGQFNYTEWNSGASMLYDHKLDPDENVNVALKPEYKEVVQKMSALLKSHRTYLEDNDPVSVLSAKDEGNSAPAWKRNPFSLKNAKIGHEYVAYVNWVTEDKENDDLSYTDLTGPAWLKLTNAEYGKVEGIPQMDNLGTNLFRISVSDGVNEPVEGTFRLEVAPLK